MIGGKQQAPLINLNGTSADELLTQVIDAHRAVSEAIRVIQNIAPHGRDYQTAPDGAAFRIATAQHRSRLIKLNEIAKEYEDLGQQINEQRAKLKNGSNNIPGVHKLEAAPLIHEPKGGDDEVDN